MYPNTVHRWCTRLILQLFGASLGCASIVSHAGDLSSATHSNGFMAREARGAALWPGAAGHSRPDFVLPLTGGTKGGGAPLIPEECEEEDDVQPAAAPQQAPVLAVAAPTLATQETQQTQQTPGTAPHVPSKEEAAAVAPPPPPAPEWELAPSDKTLNAALSRWAEQAGWQLLWEFPHDYEIDARSTVPGTFEEAVDAVARSIDTAEAPMRAIFYKGNKVLRIVAKGRE